MQTLTLPKPDDWHIHLRDGDALALTALHAAQSFRRVICMPNLALPVVNVEDARAYRERILAALEGSGFEDTFEPLLTLYLTDATTPKDIKDAAASGFVKAVKLYPAHATTNSAHGVTDVLGRLEIFETMADVGMPLLMHGEVTHEGIDIFDREARFLDEVLTPLIDKVEDLKMVLEHITTAQAVDFVLEQGASIGATITPQHLLLNRNHMLIQGIRPHLYCLPILKRKHHQIRLLEAATSGCGKFFLGTDSAPHPTDKKEASCGCAGCYSAPHALALYATAFDSVGKIEALADFAGRFGARFYGLKPHKEMVTLIKDKADIPTHYPYMQSTLTPLLAGESLPWRVLEG